MGLPLSKESHRREIVETVRRERAERLLSREISWSPDGSVELVLTREFLVPTMLASISSMICAVFCTSANPVTSGSVSRSTIVSVATACFGWR